MASTPQQPQGSEPDLKALREAIGSGDPLRAMPALTQLRFCSDEDAVPLLVLGSEQEAFLVRSLSCSGLGYKRTEQGWTVLERLLRSDGDANVRAEAANALASYGVARAWPLLKAAFDADSAWLGRCSMISVGCSTWRVQRSPMLMERFASAEPKFWAALFVKALTNRLVSKPELCCCHCSKTEIIESSQPH